MIKRIVKLEIEPQKQSEFVCLFNKLKNQITDFKGCISVELQQDLHSPNIFFTYSLWHSESSLNIYRDSIFFRHNWKKVKKLLVNKPLAWSVKEIL